MNSILIFTTQQHSTFIMDVNWVNDCFDHPEMINTHITTSMLNAMEAGVSSVHVELKHDSSKQCHVLFDDMADIYYPSRNVQSV